jgi:hypothetical protein
MVKEAFEQQQQPEEHRPKKTVNFYGAVRVYPHLHINDVTAVEWSKAWYNEEEIAEIKAECTLTVNLVKSGHLSSIGDDCNEWSTLCFRGLEFRTPEGAQRRRENKYMAWDRVLEEQDAQYASGVFDADSIAHKYTAVSFHCQAEAHAQGMDDARAVVSMNRARASPTIQVHNNNIVLHQGSKANSPSPTLSQGQRVIPVPVSSRHCSAAA